MVELINQTRSSRCNHYVLSLTKNNGLMREKLEALGVSVFGPIDGLWFLFKTAIVSQKNFEAGTTFFCGWMYHGIIVAALLRKFVPGSVFTCCVRTGMRSLEWGQISDRIVFRIAKKAASVSDRIVFNSFDSQRYHVERGFCCEDMVVVHNGIRMCSFEVLEQLRIETRRSLGIVRSARVICHVGRSHPVKNHSLFWLAISNLASSGLNCEVIAVGKGVIVPEWLEQRNVRIHLIGEVADVLPFLAASDVYCQTSLTESFPTALAEALGTGIYGIASDVGDTKLILDNYGAIYDPSDGVHFEQLLRESFDLELFRNVDQMCHIASKFGLEPMNETLFDRLTFIQ